MLRKFTCIVCPNGCEIEVRTDEAGERVVTGALCPKGEAYVNQELVNPQRTIATSVLVKGGVLPLASVRLTAPVPKERLFDVMAEIKSLSVEAPVTAGTILIKNVLGFDSDVIVTKHVEVRNVKNDGRNIDR